MLVREKLLNACLDMAQDKDTYHPELRTKQFYLNLVTHLANINEPNFNGPAINKLIGQQFAYIIKILKTQLIIDSTTDYNGYVIEWANVDWDLFCPSGRDQDMYYHTLKFRPKTAFYDRTPLNATYPGTGAPDKPFHTGGKFSIDEMVTYEITEPIIYIKRTSNVKKLQGMVFLNYDLITNAIKLYTVDATTPDSAYTDFTDYINNILTHNISNELLKKFAGHLFASDNSALSANTLFSIVNGTYKINDTTEIKENTTTPISTTGVLSENKEKYMGIQLLHIPTTCPRCGHPTVIKTEPASGVKTLWCSNDSCGARGIAKWEHFVARDAMNINGVSTAILQDMLELGIINDSFASLYEASFEDFFRLCTDIDGYGETKVSKIINAVTASRKTSLERVIFALGIPNIGLQTAKQIAKLADYNADDLLDTSILAKIMQTNGLGPVVADSYKNFMINNGDQFVELIDQLEIEVPQATTGELSGLTFCCTGAVNIYANRKQLQASIEARGGKFTSSVTGNTNYLITNDTTSGSAKNKAAQKLGIPIISEQDFIDRFGM